MMVDVGGLDESVQGQGNQQHESMVDVGGIGLF
jgi:hypothetical protein